MKKKFLRIIGLLMVLGLLFLTIPIKAYEPIDYEEEDGGGCTISTPGFPDKPCQRIWCNINEGYNGCGMGNGPNCSPEKSC